ncbi:hypothetical protein F4801DRAFT_541154 [Xylaria longipes]|nr:hypothetical protein F4801DRAFT_541154 [Xylaria longipes]RYC57061.1 hypothetical protein CHU98_g9152 [Xylaria longipes]
MHGNKFLLSVFTLAGTALAQSSTSKDPACLASFTRFRKEVPTIPPALHSYLDNLLPDGPVTAPSQTTALGGDTLANPEGYQEVFCSIASGLPVSLLPDLKSYGAGLLSYGSVHLGEYDAYVTNCVTTGEAASTILSQIHAMFTGTADLCQLTTSAVAPGGSSNGTYPATPAPTATSSNTNHTSLTTSIPFAAAAKPTGAFVGAVAIGGLLGAVAML